MQPNSPTILHVVRQRAADTPDAPAIIYEPRDAPSSTLTYLEIWNRAKAVAAELRDSGRTGDRVVLLFSSGPAFAEAFLGCLLARRVPIPAVVPRNEKALKRTIAIVQDSGAAFILTAESVRSRLEGFLSAIPLPDGYSPPPILAPESISSTTASEDIESRLSDVAFLQYTSGSTANPRGVVVGHDNLMDNLRRTRQPFGFEDPDATMVNWLPAYHDMGLIAGWLQPLHAGRKTVLMSPGEFIQQPIRWLELITKYRGTISGGPNFAYDACTARVSKSQMEKLDLRSWSIAFNGSEPVRASTIASFATKFEACGFDANAIFPCYGLAESTLMVTCRGTLEYSPVRFDRDRLREGVALPSETPNSRTLVGCGPPSDDHELAIVRPDAKARCAESEVGEIWVSGPSVCRGYWNRPEDNDIFTAQIADDPTETPFLRTGDLGLLHDGQLYISGRLKNTVIVRGNNYASEDLEDLSQAAHPAVAAAPAAAFGIMRRSGETLVIAQEIRRASIADFDPAEVTAAIQESIVTHNGIRASEILIVRPGGLPRTTSGKLQRHRARDLYKAGKLAVMDGPEPASESRSQQGAGSRGG